MSNRAKGHALRQTDPYRIPARPKLKKPRRGEPDGGTGGDTDDIGVVLWGMVFCAVILLIIRLIF